MRIILRKNDSATSLLLFVYNNYLALNGEDSIPLASLLKFIGVFGKHETAVRMSLSRAVKSDILMNERRGGEVFYTLTEKGKNAIQAWNESVLQFWLRYRMRQAGWDGKWYFVTLQLPAEQADARRLVTDRLQQLGMAQMSHQTWFSPYARRQELVSLFESLGVKKDYIELYGEMTVHTEQQAALEGWFGVNQRREGYQRFVDKFTPAYEQTKHLVNDRDFQSSGLALPILHELGLHFFQIAFEDAVLPKELIPQREGDEAAAIMSEFRELLLPAVQHYLVSETKRGV